jgi:hypothetical protein
MRILFLPDVKYILNVLAGSHDTKSSFTFSLITCQELLGQKYDVGYFYISSENITVYNDFYPLFKKIVSIFDGNIRKYILSADFIMIPIKSDFLMKVRRCP